MRMIESVRIMRESVNLHADASPPPEVEQRSQELKAQMNKLNQAWTINKC